MISLSSFVAGPLRLKSPYGEVEGGVDVAHVVEQADLGGRVVGVGRRLGAGDKGAGLKENLRRLRRFGGLRWLYLGFWLVWLSCLACCLVRILRAGFRRLGSCYSLVQLSFGRVGEQTQAPVRRIFLSRAEWQSDEG